MERSGPSILMDANPVTDVMMQQANSGSVIITTNDAQDRMRGLVQLNNLSSAYLFVTRPVDGRVLNHISMTSDIANQYLDIKGRRVDLQLSMMILFGLFSLLLLMAAVWFGLHFSEQLIRPVRKLVAGAERVRAGELDINIPDQGGEDELSDLTQAFNRMTDRLNEQRDALIAANKQIDERRQFIETVLSGVSAGVIGVSANGEIQLANQSAARIMGKDPVGHDLRDVFEHSMDLIAPLGPDKPHKQHSLDYDHPDGGIRNLRLNIGIELGANDRVIGYVITLDDMTELIAAQRKAAWGDVAQRIAHEIKNPLTPIQLAAERLRRRYGDEIDDEIFDVCTDTIIRHVGNIGRMVREFSNFARLPEPVRRPINLNRLIPSMLDFQRQANPDIIFNFTPAADSAEINADQDQVEQAVSNIIINASQAMKDQENQQINLDIQSDGTFVDLIITDNGPGFPPNLISKITDPYVTTREGGTGLGLAIVRKIMDDHEGRLSVENRSLDEQNKQTGAIVTLSFPAMNDNKKTDKS
jgi:two-component system nitrogen regulation sensor histidine kinase NtrY